MPRHHSKDIGSQAGQLRMESYVYEESATMAYMVAYTDYPVDYVDRTGWKAFLEQARSGAIRSLGLNGRVKEEPITINSFNGVRFRCDGGGQYLVSQFLLVGNRLFQCTLLSQGSYPADVVVEQFFDKFHLVFSTTEVEAPDDGWWPKEMDSLERAMRGDTTKAR
jgi:hypothetical protein